MVLAIAAVLTLSSGGARATDDELLASFVRNLGARRNALATLRCITLGTTSVRAGGLTKQVAELDPTIKQAPETDTEFSNETRWLLDFTHNCSRKVFSQSSFDIQAKGYRPTVNEVVCNGKECKEFPTRTPGQSGRGGSRYDLAIRQPNSMRASLCGEADYPVFFACGVIPVIGNPDPLDLRAPLDPGVFTIHGRALIGNEECVVIRPRNAGDTVVHELWLDKDCRLLRRHVTWANGKQWGQVDVTEYAQAKDFPRPTKWTSYSFVEGELSKATNWTVKQWDEDPAVKAEEFEAELSAGMLVISELDRKTYRVAGDGKTLVEVIDVPPSAPRPVRKGWTKWALPLAVTAIVIGIGALVYRKYRRPKESYGSQS
jgi:hypothetical protein